MSMTPNRAYVCRAIFEWVLDNNCTPYLYVNAMAENVEVPTEYVQNGQIVLNVAPAAVQNFTIHNDYIAFNARFGGVPRDIFVPIWGVLGMVASETNQGIFFDPEEIEPYAIDGFDPEPPTPPVKPVGNDGSDGEARTSTKGRPSLKIVK